MSILATASFMQEAAPAEGNAAVEIDGERVRALGVAYDAYREKMPEAKIENYTVKVNGKQDGKIEVAFVPKLAQGEQPTLGGRTSLGRGLTVWVAVDDFSVDRVAFAR
ncbi:hypothetical protein [Luteimonas suaedae]|uniref:hypothetical protein n=1 Tax=Luteimonas suaedae TaxID=2605430 RepID=UPI0011EF45B4|nr:hypothetical protein [Luteimonas suaedae]